MTTMRRAAILAPFLLAGCIQSGTWAVPDDVYRTMDFCHRGGMEAMRHDQGRPQGREQAIDP